jgi:hypothetical protein
MQVERGDPEEIFIDTVPQLMTDFPTDDWDGPTSEPQAGRLQTARGQMAVFDTRRRKGIEFSTGMDRRTPHGSHRGEANFLRWRAALFIDGRNTERVRVGCDQGDTEESSEDVIESISDSEKERGVAENSRLHSHKQVLSKYSVQDGGPQITGSVIEKGNVVGQCGHQSGLPSYFGGTGIDTLPMFLLRRSVFSVCGNALRRQDGSEGIYQNYAPLYCGDSSPVESESDPVYR